MRRTHIIKFCSTILLFLGGISIANANAPFKKVAECQSDYFNGSYCLSNNLTAYKKALKTQKANFNQKYILLNVGNLNSIELIALDTQTGIGYPLHYQFTGWEDAQGNVLKKPSFEYSLHDPKVCLFGSQYDGEHTGTHETYSNIKHCFSIQHTKYSIGFESDYTDRIQYEYDEKAKKWKPTS